MLYFIDDLSSPPPDTHGCQPHVELLRQMVDRYGFYDIETSRFCGVDGARCVAAMNPVTGATTMEALCSILYTLHCILIIYTLH